MCEHADGWKFAGRAWGETLPDCEQPNMLLCMGCGEVRVIRCGKTSSRACSYCGAAHRSRVGIVAGSGMVLGREGLFITLTAPSWREHFLPNGAACKCTGGGCEDLAQWNADAGRRFNRLIQELRRGMDLDFQYFKAAEVQRRGALHFHVLVRPGRQVSVSREWLRSVAIHHGFGHSVDVQPLTKGHASYAAKYVSKASDERSDVPWRGYARTERIDPQTGETVKGRRVAYRATYRTWSASARWGESMSAVRGAQSHYLAVIERLLPWRDRVDGDGLGISWPGDADGCPRRPPESSRRVCAVT